MRQLIDAAHDAIVVMDENGLVVGWNRRASELFGWTLAEVRGRSVAELLVPTELRKLHRAGIVRALREPGPDLSGRHEFPALRRDGMTIPVEIGISLLDSRVGRFFVAFIRDNTERVHERVRQRELQRANEMTQLVIENTGLAVAMLNLNGQYLQVNDRVGEISGYSRQELFDRSLLDLMAPEDRDRVAGILARATDTGNAVSRVEAALLRKDGERRLVSFGISPVVEDGFVTSFVVAGEDITERRQTQEALANTQKLESLSALAGGVAHDFNNLLMAILGNVAVVRSVPPEDQLYKEALDDIETAGKQAAELARQMLAYAGKANTAITSLDFPTLVAEMDPLLRAVVPRAIELRVEPDEKDARVAGDATQLRQVILNIVVNAAEAIGSGGGRISVTTGRVFLDALQLGRFVGGESALPGHYAYIQVSDNGPGMSPEVRQRVFDPFFSTRFAGRGLGLASVFGIVRGHNGVLQVESTPGHGARFTVYLPSS